MLEFDPDGNFIREIGKNLYAWSFGHTVRIDKEQNQIARGESRQERQGALRIRRSRTDLGSEPLTTRALAPPRLSSAPSPGPLAAVKARYDICNNLLEVRPPDANAARAHREALDDVRAAAEPTADARGVVQAADKIPRQVGGPKAGHAGQINAIVVGPAFTVATGAVPCLNGVIGCRIAIMWLVRTRFATPNATTTPHAALDVGFGARHAGSSGLYDYEKDRP